MRDTRGTSHRPWDEHLVLGWIVLVPISVVLHEVGHLLPPWLAGCPVELYVDVVPRARWPVCSTSIDTLGHLAGPLASLAMAGAGVAIQRRRSSLGLLLAGLGLFLPAAAAFSLLNGRIDAHDTAVLAWRIGLPGLLVTGLFSGAGLGLATVGVLRTSDPRRTLVSLALGMTIGTLAWCALGRTFSGAVLRF